MMAARAIKNPSCRRRLGRKLRIEPLEQRTLLSMDGWTGTVIHDASGNLFTVDLDNAMELHYVGNTDAVMFDMAFSPQGKLYGVGPSVFDHSLLYSFDVDFESPSPAITTEWVRTITMGQDRRVYVNSLKFHESGELYAAGYDDSDENYLFKIGLGGGGAGAQRVLSLEEYVSAGDLTFDTAGNLYLTTTYTDTTSGDLLRIPPGMNSFEVVGQTGFDDFYGLIYGPDPVMYGFREGKQVYRINPENAQTALVGQLDHAWLDWVNGAATVFRPPTDLGEVDFRELPDQEPVLGQLWYRVEATRSGILTIDVSNAEPGADVDLTLYRMVEPGVLDPLETGELRLDYGHAAAGEEYFVKIEGAESNVDVRVANLVCLAGNGATVYGTDQNDTFEFAPGSPYTIKINGLDYHYNFSPHSLATVTFHGGAGHDTALLTGSSQAEVATLDLASLSGIVTRSRYYKVEVTGTRKISFDGGGGSDSATLTGSAYNDTITLQPYAASVARVGSLFQVAGIAVIEVDAGAGHDSAELGGTAYNETVNLRPFEAELFASAFWGSVSDVESISAVAGDGYDEAVLSDSPGQDTFEATPTEASLTGPGFSLSASGFDEVRGEATPGGSDVARLYDNAAELETFVATLGHATLSGEHYSNHAVGFRYVHAYSSSESDEAKLYDHPATRETFLATPADSVLANSDFFNQAVGFRYVDAYSSGGGDEARLYDGPATQDTFVATPAHAFLESSHFRNQAVGFPRVLAYSRGGADEANLYDDQNKNDTFLATPGFGTLSNDVFFSRAVGFRDNHAYSSGGSDVARLYDDPTRADVLEAKPGDTSISNGGFLSQAHGFAYVHAYSTGGADKANLYDDPDQDQDDFFIATPDYAVFTTGAYSNRAVGFPEVRAYSQSGNDGAKLCDGRNTNDTFVATPEQSALHGDRFYNQAVSFRYVHAFGSRSGNDQAELNDSALIDYLYAADNWAYLHDGDASFSYRASGFDLVKAISSTPGDTKEIRWIDYILALEGYWQDPSP